MRINIITLTTTLLLGATAIAITPATAAPTGGAALAKAAGLYQQSLVTEVQRRRRGRRFRARRFNPGAAAAFGVLGAIGTLMLLDAAGKAQWCSQQEGYDPETHTFVGNDGEIYRCP